MWFPSWTRIADESCSVIVSAALRIVTPPWQKTGGRVTRSATLVVPSSGSACTTWPAWTSRLRSVAAT